MSVLLPLDEMTVAEKLAAMETLWADLSRHTPDEVVPQWHKEVLAERELRLSSGTEPLLDWQDAKNRILQERHESKDS